MAESETAGLDILIKQRISRPSFARMISWEIERSSDYKPRKRYRSPQQRKAEEHHLQKSGGQDPGGEVDEGGVSDSNTYKESTCVSDSDGSEYFSAEESLQDSSSSVSDENGESGLVTRENAGNASLTETEDSALTSRMENISVAGSKQHRRAPSKKQKKKRRHQREYCSVQHYAEFTAPFRNVENINFSVDELQGDLVSKTEDTAAEVPTLFELCMQTLWLKNKQPTVAFELLPGPIKKSVSSWRQQQAFTSMQLSCLFRLLALVEKDALKGFRDINWFAARNVWSLGCQIDDPPPLMFGSGMTAIIPYNYASCGFYDYRYDFIRSREKSEWNIQFAICLTSLLVSVLDLMLPMNLRAKKGKELITGDQTDKALTSAVASVLNHLKKRYPDTVQLCERRVLPYIYGLRGHNKLAVNEFLQLVESVSDHKQKAYFMMEAARFCRLQDQADTARKLYREVQNVLLEAPAVMNTNSVKAEIAVQTLMLCANTYDQGQMTEQKAAKSLGMWKLLINMAPTEVEHRLSFVPAVDAVLCYHLAHLPGKTVKEKLKGVVGVIDAAARQFGHLSLHLSLIHAWMGDQYDSARAYNRVGGGVINPPGLELKPENVNKSVFTPWQPILSTAQTPPEALEVVWRTQLGHLRVIKDLNVFEGDLCGKTLNLRLSSEGHLTADLHLLLPPVKAINLDLHTGRLLMPTVPGQTHTCKTFFSNRFYSEEPGTCLVEYYNGPFAETPIELYSDEEGVRVHLIAAFGNCTLVVGNMPTHIQWTNGKGLWHKLSLMHLLKKSVYQRCEREIRDHYTADPNTMEQTLRGLEYAFSHNLQITRINCHSIGRILADIQAGKDKKRAPATGKRVKPPQVSYSRSQLQARMKFRYSVEDFVSYGHTVMLMGSCEAFHFFLFFDVSSKERFQKPVLQFSSSSFAFNLEVPLRQKHRVPRSEVLLLRNTNGGQYEMYGPGGLSLKEKDALTENASEDDSICVLGSSAYRVKDPENQNNEDPIPFLIEVKYCHEQQTTSTFLHDLGLNLRQVKVIADKLLLVCSDGLRVLCPQKLEVQPLFQGPNCDCRLPISENGQTLLTDAKQVTVLQEKCMTTSSGLPATFVAVAVDSYLLTLAVQESSEVPYPIIEVAFCVKFAGHAKEVCFVGHSAGYLVSTTLHTQPQQHAYYRETVFHLSHSGQLLGLLPCLGPGPREFFPFLLPPARGSESEEAGGGSEEQMPAWHIYMRDGHEGIIAVKLQ